MRSDSDLMIFCGWMNWGFSYLDLDLGLDELGIFRYGFGFGQKSFDAQINCGEAN